MQNGGSVQSLSLGNHKAYKFLADKLGGSASTLGNLFFQPGQVNKLGKLIPKCLWGCAG